MAKAPKPWKLQEEETLSSFDSWRNRLVYYMQQQDKRFAKLLVGLDPADEQAPIVWQKETSENPTRNFTDDDEDTPDSLTAAQKAKSLNDMLGFISEYSPPLLAHDIKKASTSFENICQKIRKYYGFKQSEAQFMKFAEIAWETGERPEKLYQRVVAHLQDNLLRQDSQLVHDGETPVRNEIMSPTVERLAVLKWMELIHPGLPALVKRTFAYDLQRMTLKDMQPQIADAIDGFLEELKQEAIGSARARVFQRNFLPTGTRPPRPPPTPRQPISARQYQPTNNKSCFICRAANRRSQGHSFMECNYLSKVEKNDIAKSCRVSSVDEGTEIDAEDALETLEINDDTAA
ncbi:hypothetical protein SNE40_000287 [Patella caerulea]|uniref:Uncharacterized protein n=1 Tax=Patella caerulea TaxID=87958 RepID=A0AAN8KBY2_PATCE